MNLQLNLILKILEQSALHTLNLRDRGKCVGRFQGCKISISRFEKHVSWMRLTYTSNYLFVQREDVFTLP